MRLYKQTSEKRVELKNTQFEIYLPVERQKLQGIRSLPFLCSVDQKAVTRGWNEVNTKQAFYSGCMNNINERQKGTKTKLTIN